MAEFIITSPAGEKFKITAPDDASQDQVLAFAQKNMPQGEKPQQGALDAANGVWFVDDAQVAEVYMRRIIAPAPESVGTLVVLGTPTPV